jgi:hypothetical protein
MAYSVSSHIYGTTNAKLKEWVQRFIDQMTLAGWVQTSDTGQIVVSSITEDSPLAAVNLGYAVFVLDDSYRLTDPVYLRAEFILHNVGHTTAQADYKGPQVLLTVGFETDGAGAIVGQNLSTGLVKAGAGYPLTFKIALDVFAAGDGWATIVHGAGFAYNMTSFYVKQIVTLLIQRMRDQSGNVIPGELYVVMPEPNRNQDSPSDAYWPSFNYNGSRDSGSTMLVGAFLSKFSVSASSAVTKGVIGSDTLSGSVNGIIQAQPAWMAYPQIAPFLGLILVPTSVVTSGQVLSASIDGVNEFQYAALWAVPYNALTQYGAMYAVDAFAGRSYCFAARVA